ncbi:MAG: MCE family protein [Planctomycetes bacterium]|nr:MCE family protein [Planctomycetota bacterium]
MARVAFGFLIFIAFAAAAVGGVYLLYQSEGGGLPFSVSFADARGLEPNARVVYRDQPVGRVVTVRSRDNRAEVECRLSSEHAGLLREGSRFWIQDNIGGAFVCFDTPGGAGANLAAGAKLNGLEKRPEPDERIEARPRKLISRPVWLCEARTSATLRESGDLIRDERRKAAAAVVKRAGRSCDVLAPAWVWESFKGELVSRSAFVEFAGGETCTARIVGAEGGLILLRVEDTAYSGGVAELWTTPLPEGQTMALVNCEDELWLGDLRAGELKTGATLANASLALVEGVKVCGFALPVVGERIGAKWVGLIRADMLLR